MKPTRQTGFTLVELILVMVVMGLLAGLALRVGFIQISNQR